MGLYPMIILFLGADWWGSDARALAAALRRDGHALVEVNYEDYLPTAWSSLPLRVLRRMTRSMIAADYNNSILQQVDNAAIDFLLVFKGMLLNPATLRRFVEKRIPRYCVYPDVGFEAYGRNISACLPLYDCVFTTKTFHLDDLQLRGKLKDLRLIAHGFDPDVHRPVEVAAASKEQYAADVCFVGVWSGEKETWLRAIRDELPDVRLAIWGGGWQNSAPEVQRCWRGRGAFGDELAVICAASKINLGLLTGKHADSASGDQVTARTWQIPACGGFLLHYDTEEFRQYFTPGVNAESFGSSAELVSQILRYLADEERRRAIAAAGRRHTVQSNYTYDSAASEILSYHSSNAIGRT